MANQNTQNQGNASNQGQQNIQNKGEAIPHNVDGTPDKRFRGNAPEGSPAFDSRNRNPHAGSPPPERQRTDRPVGDPDKDIVNADGTLDMRFLENRIKAGLVADPRAERAQAAIDEAHIADPKQRMGKSNIAAQNKGNNQAAAAAPKNK